MGSFFATRAFGICSLGGNRNDLDGDAAKPQFAFVMFCDALIDVFGKANIIALRMRYGTNDVNVKHAVRRRSAEAELWRTALFPRGLNTLFDLGSPEAGVPAVAPASAGLSNGHFGLESKNSPPPFD